MLIRCHRMKGARPCGCRARTMRASPRRTWWRKSSPRKSARPARIWAARRLSRKCGNGRNSTTATIIKPAQETRLLLRLGAGALHHGRGPVQGRAQGVRAALQRRAHLPRQIHHQLVPALPHRAVGRRGRAQGSQRANSIISDTRLKTGTGLSVVATTRPETMLGDTAVAVNPADERYTSLVGKMLVLPLVNREIPVIADDFVDRKFGTGAVKVTPAHDPNDFQMGRRHAMAPIDVMDETGHMTRPHRQNISAWTVSRAAKKSSKTWRRSALLKKSRTTPMPWATATAATRWLSRSYSNQWFVKMKPLAERALEAVEDGERHVYPGPLEKNLYRLDGKHPRLVHLAADLVGTSHSGVVLPRLRRDHCRRRRPRVVPRSAKCASYYAGRRRARHMVFVVAVAVFNHGLAAGHRPA